MASQPILFQEKQHFTQVWLWVVLLGVASIFWVGFFYQLLSGHNFGRNPVVGVEAALLLVLVGVGLPFFFYKMRLVTEVYPGYIRLRFFPFHLKAVEIPLHLVRDYERVTYNAIRDYGGWGIRWGLRGKAYNMSGSRGVQLYFYNRKPLLIGSQKPEELFEAIREAKNL
ncbi:DUF6141 family protein [Pontibacter beigongshangensis]|uniref:DUF6141 family protein n=1 Tax=Pontibacter beigongshangensis TaxID=2574733 RepID=UPI00164F1FEA|nr:DUF6141 family protein [Pontibacter beigongshangensis]